MQNFSCSNLYSSCEKVAHLIVRSWVLKFSSNVSSSVLQFYSNQQTEKSPKSFKGLNLVNSFIVDSSNIDAMLHLVLPNHGMMRKARTL